MKNLVYIVVIAVGIIGSAVSCVSAEKIKSDKESVSAKLGIMRNIQKDQQSNLDGLKYASIVEDIVNNRYEEDKLSEVVNNSEIISKELKDNIILYYNEMFSDRGAGMGDVQVGDYSEETSSSESSTENVEVDASTEVSTNVSDYNDIIIGDNFNWDNYVEDNSNDISFSVVDYAVYRKIIRINLVNSSGTNILYVLKIDDNGIITNMYGEV